MKLSTQFPAPFRGITGRIGETSGPGIGGISGSAPSMGFHPLDAETRGRMRVLRRGVGYLLLCQASNERLGATGRLSASAGTSPHTGWQAARGTRQSSIDARLGCTEDGSLSYDTRCPILIDAREMRR